MATKDDLLSTALKLPPEERQQLVHALATSLEGTPPEESALVKARWREVISRRAREVAEGTAETVDGIALVNRAIRTLRGRR